MFDANPWRNCSSTAVHRWVLTSSEPYLREVRLHLDMFYYIAFRSLGRSDGCVVDTHPTTSARMHRSPDRSREYAADGEVMRRMLLDRLGSTAALEEIVDHLNLTKKVVGESRRGSTRATRRAPSRLGCTTPTGSGGWRKSQQASSYQEFSGAYTVAETSPN